jgi:hypothetical protein
MTTDQEISFFDVADQTALVCIDHPAYHKLIVPQLTELGYKVHLGLFEDDVMLKLATYSYNVVIIYENFKGTSVGENAILKEMVRRPSPMRREHFLVLLSHRCTTNDAVSAFVHSVDQVLNVADIANFRPVLRRGVAQHQELYQPFRDALRAVQAS